MSLWWILLIVCAAGAVGGIVNALMSDNGFLLPQSEKDDKYKIIRPGFFGNIIISAVAAGISWGLYGPLASYPLIGGTPSPGVPTPAPSLTVSALMGAALVGVAGARWLTNEVDKKLLKAAASEAAGAKPTDDNTAKKILMSRPTEALRIAKTL
jgi:hypothetical protein